MPERYGNNPAAGIRPVKLTVYAWAEPDEKGEVWYCECVTLNLAVRRRDYGEAVQAMSDQIQLYFEVALQADPRELIPRPSPLARRSYLWWAYRFGRLIQVFSGSPRMLREERLGLTHAHAA